MHITLYQIILAMISAIIIIQRTSRFFRKEQAQTLIKYVTVVGVWGSIGVISLFPQIAHFIRKTFGFGDNFNTSIFIVFVILFVLYFRLLSIVEKIESTLTEIIRKDALKHIKK